MDWLFIISFLATIAEITPYLENVLHEYYESDLVKNSTKIWRPHMIGFQTAIGIAMQQTYGFNGMNIYIKRPANPLFVTKGYYHTDNQVHIILEDLVLDSYPTIYDIRTTFPLTQNALKLDGLVSKIILHSDYTLIRNATDIVYDVKAQNAYEVSPFLFEQVQRTGQLAIQVDGCKISGVAVVSLSGRSVNLGNALFKLSNCHFNFEIFSHGTQGPPVIANYLPNSGGIPLERLIMNTMESELAPKLQAALTSYVNTSDVFDDLLPVIRSQEQSIFEGIKNYINNVVRNMNVLTINRNIGKYAIPDKYSIRCSEMIDGQLVDIAFSLYNVVVNGLETLYTSHTGGPLLLTTLKVSEELRYSSLQVRGILDYQAGSETKGMYEFGAEISDVAVDLIADIREPYDETSRYVHTLEFIGWRDYQFSCPGHYNRSGEAFVAGWILSKIPSYLTKHLRSIIDDAAKEADNEYKIVKEMLQEDKSQTNTVEDNEDIATDYDDAESGDSPLCRDPKHRKEDMQQENTLSSAEQFRRMKKMRMMQQKRGLRRSEQKATRTTMVGNQRRITSRNVADNEINMKN